MAWYDRDEMDRRREEERCYENDVFYDVWRSGGNPDAVDYDRARDAYYDGMRAEDHAAALMREESARRAERRAEQECMEEAEYYAMQESQYAEE